MSREEAGIRSTLGVFLKDPVNGSTCTKAMDESIQEPKGLQERYDGKHDSVNHPRHYNRGSIEVADFVADQELDFFLGNVVKYVCRAGYKGDAVEDLKKAAWYLNYEINMLTKKQEEAKVANREVIKKRILDAIEEA